MRNFELGIRNGDLVGGVYRRGAKLLSLVDVFFGLVGGFWVGGLVGVFFDFE